MSFTYADARFSEVFWQHVYPCPLTGCWFMIDFDQVSQAVRWCRQEACWNPDHGTDYQSALDELGRIDVLLQEQAEDTVTRPDRRTLQSAESGRG